MLYGDYDLHQNPTPSNTIQHDEGVHRCFLYLGIISRQEAEELLLNKQTGTFLVRVSERVWGYTITYRSEGRCKHYLVDSSENTYQFFGHNQIAHPTLHDLVEFHKIRPISGMGQELLQFSCGQEKSPPDYHELLDSPGETETTCF